MSFLGELRRQSRSLAGRAVTLLPIQGPTRPTFIVGCGRSGTTILGTALSQHREVTYLHEPRDLWFRAYPETDVWTEEATARHGRLVLTSTDVETSKSRKLRRLFALQTMKTGRAHLVEKLPANSFRLGFVTSIFPDARFIFIYRNGLEVARSIQKHSDRGPWFGANGYKWRQLVQVAQERDDTAGLPALCATSFDRGLLEWRLSTEATVDVLRELPDERVCEISYSDLTRTPRETVERALSFLEIDNDEHVMHFVRDNISRRTDDLSDAIPSDREQSIGGPLLSISMLKGNDRGLVQRFTEASERESRRPGWPRS
ncbi:MAG: sulfotransferase family protein [Vicinamibacteraceae bacterium]